MVYFTRRFCLAEDRVGIEARVNRPDYEQQEIMMKIDLGSLRVQNPLQEIKIVVLKNYNWHNKVKLSSPK